MTKQELASLGLTEKDVLNRLVEKLAENLIAHGEDYRSDFERKIEDGIRKRVDEVLDKALKAHVLPNVNKMVESICLQETNKWGEKRGTKLTFIEYLVQRVDAYIREEVNYDGKAKDGDTYNWRPMGTRIQHMVHEHLKYNVARAMENAMKNATTSVAKGLEEACKIAIDNIKVTVNTKVESK